MGAMKARFQCWWAVIWRLAGGVGVRLKIMGIVLGLVVLLGLGLTWQVRTSMTRTLTAELEQLGISVTRDLAARSADLVLTNNLFALYELVQDTMANDPDVRYAFILSPEGEILAHSFGGGFPLDLLSVNIIHSDQHHQLEILDTEEGLIHDVAVPVFQGQAGVARVGVSEQRLRQILDAVTRRLLLTTLLVSLGGVAVSTALTWVLTRPVLRLVDAIQAVARGDLTYKITPWAKDEIGQLEASFNAMVDDLAHAREQTEAYDRRLLRRNRELSALNAVSQAVSGPLSLNKALERALEQVLGVVDSDAGWICLLEEDGTCRAFAGIQGLCRPQAADEPRPCLRHCGCRQAIETGRPVLIRPLTADCPLLDVEVGGSQPIVGHVAVPLLVKARAVGLLNVACHEESGFELANLDLLSAVGQQLGVAIENTRLWEELEQREALRGQLLEQVIATQEEERRRIARELHDETSQSLASLVVGLKAAQAALSIDPARSEEILLGLRASVSQTVKELHNIIYDLRPTLLDDLGLIPALRWYAGSRLEACGIEVELEVEGSARRLPPEVETVLFRIAQEAVTNVVRHAGASRVRLGLRFGAEEVAIHVRDNGRGFEARETMDAKVERQGFGLLGIQERATLLGGRFEVQSQPGKGTDLRVWVPLSSLRGDDGQDTNSVGG